MKKEKIGSLAFIIVLICVFGYGFYRNTGEVVHELLVIEGETARVGALTTRKIRKQVETHEFAISEDQEYSIFLEGRFPDPVKRVHAENNYAIKISSSDGLVLFEDNVHIKFTKKDKKEGLGQIVANLFPGKISKKVTDLPKKNSDGVLTINFKRLSGDSVANELFLVIRKNRN